MDPDEPNRWHDALICLYLFAALFGIGGVIAFVWSLIT